MKVVVRTGHSVVECHPELATAEAEALRPLLAPMVAARYSLRAMAEALAKGGTVNRKGAPLAPVQVARLLDRLELRAA